MAQIPLNQIKFKKLGYLAFDSNQKSQYQARELKSVYTDCVALLLKIVCREPHSNEFNLFNQVGLIAVSCLGQMMPLSPPTPTPLQALPHSAEPLSMLAHLQL